MGENVLVTQQTRHRHVEAPATSCCCFGRTLTDGDALSRASRRAPMSKARLWEMIRCHGCGRRLA